MMSEKKDCAISHKEDNKKADIDNCKEWMKVWINHMDNLSSLQKVFVVMKELDKMDKYSDTIKKKEGRTIGKA